MSQVKLWGWDATNSLWAEAQLSTAGRLLTDSEVYAEGVAIGERAMDGNPIVETEHALNVNALLFVHDRGNDRNIPIWSVLDTGDANGGERLVPFGGWAYNGSTWDRIRNGTPSDTFANPTYALQTMGLAMGWNGSTWSRLKVESADNPNLRVKLYDGAAGLFCPSAEDYHVVTSDVPVLMTKTQIVFWRNPALSSVWHQMYVMGDGETGWNFGGLQAYAFNGATYDRLRCGAPSDTYANPSYALETGAFLMGWDSANSHWERIKVSAAGSIMTKEETSNPTSSGPITASQLLHNGRNHVYAITINKDSAAAAVVEIIDGVDASGPVQWRLKLPGQAPFVKQFWPWLQTEHGLYILIHSPVDSVVVEYGSEEP